MSIIIKPNENKILKFEVDVSGTEETPEPRLIIPISESVSLMFEGQINKDEVEVDVTDLLKLTNSKEFNGKLEVVVEGEIFTPWEDSIIIKESKQVKAKNIKTPVQESKVNVKAKTYSSKSTPTRKTMQIKKKNLGDLFGEKL